jgi:hypothetical protein
MGCFPWPSLSDNKTLMTMTILHDCLTPTQTSFGNYGSLLTKTINIYVEFLRYCVGNLMLSCLKFK